MSDKPKCGDKVTIHGTIANCDNDGAMVLFRGVWPHAVKVAPEGFHALLPAAAPQEGVVERIAAVLEAHEPDEGFEDCSCKIFAEMDQMDEDSSTMQVKWREHVAAEIAKAIGTGPQLCHCTTKFMEIRCPNATVYDDDSCRCGNNCILCGGSTRLRVIPHSKAAASVQALGDEKLKK